MALWIGLLAAVAYLFVAPVVFLGPLIPFRPRLIEAKSAYLTKIGSPIKRDLDNLLDRIDSDPETNNKLERLERLSIVNDRIARLPEWPLDTTTVQRFTVVLITPGISVLISWVLKMAIESI